MSERSDNRRPGAGPLVLAVLSLVLLAGVGGYLWLRTYGMPQPAPRQQQATDAAPPAAERSSEPFTATLYLPAEGRLATAVAAIKRDPDVQLQAREAISSLLAGDQGGKTAVLKELKLRALYLDAAGTAYLDLQPVVAGQKELRASLLEELLAVYALVNTVAQNFPEVRQVRILLDGRESRTLAGHIDLARSFVKRPDLVRVP